MNKWVCGEVWHTWLGDGEVHGCRRQQGIQPREADLPAGKCALLFGLIDIKDG